MTAQLPIQSAPRRDLPTIIAIRADAAGGGSEGESGGDAAGLQIAEMVGSAPAILRKVVHGDGESTGFKPCPVVREPELENS